VYKAIFPALAFLAIGCSSLAATPAKPHKRRQPVSTVTAKVSAKNTPRHKGKVAARVPARSFQQAPTADRYKEIQQALASKGYFKGEPNGAWGPESADALKRFQSDQNLMPDGKIGSLSLIALGLGPKRMTARSEAPPAPQAASPTSPQ
jgi:peptidoglycan hydrolase-like protein with peptidoglycan-binding domain